MLQNGFASVHSCIYSCFHTTPYNTEVTPASNMATFSVADVAQHNKSTDLYIIVDEDVYDMTSFQNEHPGGKKSKSPPLLRGAGI